MPKKHLKVIGADPDERRVVYDLIWSSASTIKKHYVKTFENIYLLKIHYDRLLCRHEPKNIVRLCCTCRLRTATNTLVSAQKAQLTMCDM